MSKKEKIESAINEEPEEIFDEKPKEDKKEPDQQEVKKSEIDYAKQNEDLKKDISDLKSSFSSLSDTIKTQYRPLETSFAHVPAPATDDENEILKAKLFDKPKEVIDNMRNQIRQEMRAEFIKQQLDNELSELKTKPDFQKIYPTMQRKLQQPLSWKDVYWLSKMESGEYENDIKEKIKQESIKKAPELESGKPRSMSSKQVELNSIEKKAALNFNMTEEQYLQEKIKYMKEVGQIKE